MAPAAPWGCRMQSAQRCWCVMAGGGYNGPSLRVIPKLQPPTAGDHSPLPQPGQQKSRRIPCIPQNSGCTELPGGGEVAPSALAGSRTPSLLGQVGTVPSGDLSLPSLLIKHPIMRGLFLQPFPGTFEGFRLWGDVVAPGTPQPPTGPWQLPTSPWGGDRGGHVRSVPKSRLVTGPRGCSIGGV